MIGRERETDRQTDRRGAGQSPVRRCHFSRDPHEVRPILGGENWGPETETCWRNIEKAGVASQENKGGRGEWDMKSESPLLILITLMRAI